VRILKDLFTRNGGVLHSVLRDATTHVVCKAEESVDSAIAKLRASCATTSDTDECVLERLGRARFVTRDWISQSLACGLQAESVYPCAVGTELAARLRPPGESARSLPPPSDAPPAAAADSPLLALQHTVVNLAMPDAAALRAAFPGSVCAYTRDGTEQLVSFQPQGWDPDRHWGFNGLWTEPFDVESAQDTLKRIWRFWHRLGGAGAALGARHPPCPVICPDTTRTCRAGDAGWRGRGARRLPHLLRRGPSVHH